MRPVMREAKVDGNKDWPEWMAFGNVTYSEAARRMANWVYQFSKEKKLPKTLRVLVRDQEEGGKEFPFDVAVSISVKVTPLRGDE